MLYVGLQALHKQFRQEYLVVVPSTVYGPEYYLHRATSFHFDLIRKILAYKHKRSLLFCGAMGTREVDLYCDFLDDMFSVLPIVKNDLINFGADADFSIRQFANIICEEAGVDPSAIGYDENAYVGARSKILNCEKLKKILPSWKRTELRLGVGRTVQWMENELF